MKVTAKSMRDRFIWILLKADTTTIRFWIIIFGICFGIDTLVNHDDDLIFYLMARLAPLSIWSALFFTHATAVVYGVMTRRFNTILLIGEGILGATLWSAVAVLNLYDHGAPDLLFGVALLALWLLLRYPTHWEYTDGS
jgi:hypothetical protein